MLKAAVVFCTQTPDHQVRTHPDITRLESYCTETASLLAGYDPDLLFFVGGPSELMCNVTPAMATAAKVCPRMDSLDEGIEPDESPIVLNAEGGVQRQIDAVIERIEQADEFNLIDRMLLICERGLTSHVPVSVWGRTKFDTKVTVAPIGNRLPRISDLPFSVASGT